MDRFEASKKMLKKWKHVLDCLCTASAKRRCVNASLANATYCYLAAEPTSRCASHNADKIVRALAKYSPLITHALGQLQLHVTAGDLGQLQLHVTAGDSCKGRL